MSIFCWSLRYRYKFLHVIITFKGSKIIYRNIRSHGAPLFIFRGWLLAPLPRVFDPRPDLGFKRVSDNVDNVEQVNCHIFPIPTSESSNLLVRLLLLGISGNKAGKQKRDILMQSFFSL